MDAYQLAVARAVDLVLHALAKYEADSAATRFWLAKAVREGIDNCCQGTGQTVRRRPPSGE